MVQEFHVVRCFSCQSFQVQQVKKVNRWTCKLCGEKQSLLKEFGRGSGADCRRHVQKLNAMRGAAVEEQESRAWSLWEQQEVEPEEEKQRDEQGRQPQGSRWSKYLDTPEEVEPQENVLINRNQDHGNRMTDSSHRETSPGSVINNQIDIITLTCDRKRKRAEEQTEAGPKDKRTPEQVNCLKPTKATPTCSPTASPGPASRWAHFLRSNGQGKEREEPGVSVWNRSSGGATASTHCDIIGRPRPLLPVSSMFESGEEFDFDDDFLT